MDEPFPSQSAAGVPSGLAPEYGPPPASIDFLAYCKAAARQLQSFLGHPHGGLHVAAEIEEVAATLPSPVVFVGSEATSERLSSIGPHSRFIHIATHGLFRRDSPMFSSIELGNGPLSLFDLYQLDLSAELVTLSG